MIWKLRTGLSLGAIILWMMLNPMGAALGQEPESAEKKGEMNPAQQGSVVAFTQFGGDSRPLEEA